jgi:hypothetical protein
MLPEAKSSQLIYASDDEANVFVLSAAGSLIGQLNDLPGPAGECTDKVGDIYIAARYDQEILEYAHGGTEPIAMCSAAMQLGRGGSAAVRIEASCRCRS